MDQTTEQLPSELYFDPSQGRSSPGTTASGVTHPVLSRLLEEVRNEKRVEATYDRVHNRHNRGQ